MSHLPEVLDAKASKEPIGKVQSIVQDLIVVQGEEDGKAGTSHQNGSKWEKSNILSKEV